MPLSNTATPKYYGQFRDAVMRGEIPICKEIEMEIQRIDELIANPIIGKTVSYDTYKRDVERAENAPVAKNDILAKRFGLAM